MSIETKESDKEKALDQMAALVLKAFPTAKEIAEWIADIITVTQEADWNIETKNDALEIIWFVAEPLLWAIIDAKTDKEKINIAKDFIKEIIGRYGHSLEDRDIYRKTMEMLDNRYMASYGKDINLRDGRKRVYQFDTLKEISKMDVGIG